MKDQEGQRSGVPKASAIWIGNSKGDSDNRRDKKATLLTPFDISQFSDGAAFSKVTGFSSPN
jgi:hypothetical protein